MSNEFDEIVHKYGLRPDHWDSNEIEELIDLYTTALDGQYSAEQLRTDLELQSMAASDPTAAPTPLHQSMLPISVIDALRTTEAFKHLFAQERSRVTVTAETEEDVERFIVQFYYTFILLSKDHVGQHQVAQLLATTATMFAQDPHLHELIAQYSLYQSAAQELRTHNEQVQRETNPDAKEGE